MIKLEIEANHKSWLQYKGWRWWRKPEKKQTNKKEPEQKTLNHSPNLYRTVFFKKKKRKKKIHSQLKCTMESRMKILWKKI